MHDFHQYPLTSGMISDRGLVGESASCGWIRDERKPLGADFRERGPNPLKLPWPRALELETLLKASFPGPGTEERIIKAFIDDVDKDHLGVDVHKKGKRIYFSYPIMILAGKKKVEKSAGAYGESTDRLTEDRQ